MRAGRMGAVAALLALGACASRGGAVRSVEVRIPVAVPCDARTGPTPAYPDTDAALREAADLFERVKLLLAGRELREAREAELDAAVRGCSGLDRENGGRGRD